jgi:hypothetical protein
MTRTPDPANSRRRSARSEIVVTTPPNDTASRPRCPQCQSGHGDTRVVVLKGQGRTVTYVCDRCLHEWDVTEKPKSYEP